MQRQHPTQMTLQELASREDALHRKTIELNSQAQSNLSDDTLKDIFAEYGKIHQLYAQLSSADLEALKRGLFIQWYALAEPNYLTGIGDLDLESENKIIQVLDNVIEDGHADNELIWMLNYYANWPWIFERLESFKDFNSQVVNEQLNRLPDQIDHVQMEKRGQMGKYWNSLTSLRKT